MATNTTGRGWAYLGTILGGTVSIAANIAHSYVPPTGQPVPADWTPETGAVVSAVFWPVALFVAVEILTRITWPTGQRWTLMRLGGLIPVALVAAVVSYRHLAGLLDHYGEDTLTVTIGPLAVDGLMVMATGALLATGTRHRAPADPGHQAPPDTVPAVTDHAPTDDTPAIPEAVDTPAPTPAAIAAPVLTPITRPDVPAHLIPTARFAIRQHEQTNGRPITADELAALLTIDPATAQDLLHTITGHQTVNGTPVGAA